MLNKKAFGTAVATFNAIFWLITMFFSLVTGVGEITLTTIGSFFPFFSYSWLGLLTIVVEHIILGFMGGWAFAWFYNRFSKSA